MNDITYTVRKIRLENKWSLRDVINTIKCPFCSAKKGNVCLSKKGRKLPLPHPKRLMLFRELVGDGVFFGGGYTGIQ